MKLQASMTVEAAGVMVVVLTTLMILMGQAMNWSARAAGNFALHETVERERHRIEHAEEEQIKEQAKGNNWELEITAPVFRPEKMLRMWSGGGYDMKTSYQRELKRNYLIVETETSEGQGEPPFEQKMLEQNQIDGILRFQVRQKDEEVRFFYEITSKQPFVPPSGRADDSGRADPWALVFGIAGHWIIWNSICSVKKRASGPGISVCGSGKPEGLAVPGAGNGM